MKNIVIILISFFCAKSLVSQIGNVRFSFDVLPNYTANVYAFTTTGTANIAGFNAGFLYKSTEASSPVLDASPLSSLGWATLGNTTSVVTNVNINIGSYGPYDRRLEFQIIDGNNDFSGNGGSTITTSPTLIAIINFSSGSSPGTTTNYAYQLSTSDPTGSAFVVYDNSTNAGNVIVQGIVEQLLPITIKTFSATKDGERTARLDWTSSSEINSDYIGIERSTDGEDWTTVGQVKAAGNSIKDIDYIYYDRSLPMVRSIDNIFYYRLKLTDLDGQYKYSETRGVNLGRLEGLVSIYPNPATDIINVDLTDMDLHEGIIHLSVYDNTGKAIISKEVNGAGIEPIQASNMAAGTYNVVVKQGDTTHRKQIIVVN